tara:strand:+ start:187 stop:534 length:348 start_codon:yes stop_codon:yes gene_type:complete
MKKKTFCFDIDNTICTTVKKDYFKAKPKKKVIFLINSLYDKGHTIKIFTGRYMGRNNDNINAAKRQGYKKTYNQLKKWNLKFHKLLLGKPSFDIFVDDKALGHKQKNIYTLNKYL